MISESEYKILKNILISDFDVWKACDAMREDSWDGYKPYGIEDVFRIIGEKFKTIETDYYFKDDYLTLEDMFCSSAGFTAGFVDGFMFISWSGESGGISTRPWLTPEERKNTHLTIGDIRKYSYIYSEIDCMEFLRMYKIHKLWTKRKDKETITTTQTTTLAQESGNFSLRKWLKRICLICVPKTLSLR